MNFTKSTSIGIPELALRLRLVSAVTASLPFRRCHRN
jgi:hypothetical protein